MGQTNLESLVDSILKLLPTKSYCISFGEAGVLSETPISAREIMIILDETGEITINGVVFKCSGSVPYTFKNIANLQNISCNVAGSAIYYPSFSQFPAITPNNV